MVTEVGRQINIANIKKQIASYLWEEHYTLFESKYDYKIKKIYEANYQRLIP